MSSGAERPGLPAEWSRLELIVRRTLDEYGRARRQLQAAEARVRELEAALQGVTQGTVDPVALADRADRLEAENAELRARLEEAGERVRRILARMQFLEEAR